MSNEAGLQVSLSLSLPISSSSLSYQIKQKRWSIYTVLILDIMINNEITKMRTKEYLIWKSSS